MDSSSSQRCARELMEAVFLVMLAIREEMRSRREPGLSVPQFRSLAFLRRLPGVGLSEMAEHIGLSLPSMSKMVDGLVSRGLVAREPSASDRRRLSLGLTPQGQRMLERARQGTQDALALRLDQLTPQQRQALLRDLGRLGQAFAAPAAPGRDKTKGSGKGLGRRPAPA